MCISRTAWPCLAIQRASSTGEGRNDETKVGFLYSWRVGGPAGFGLLHLVQCFAQRGTMGPGKDGLRTGRAQARFFGSQRLHREPPQCIEQHSAMNAAGEIGLICAI